MLAICQLLTFFAKIWFSINWKRVNPHRRFMIFVGYLLLALVTLWIVGNLLTRPLQDFFIFRPKKLHQNYQYTFANPPEEIFLETSHGGKLNALWFASETNSKGIVLYFHGNADNLARWGHLHHYFAQQGYDFFVYDYRGFGKSTGRRNERILYDDAVAVFQFVQQHYTPAQMIIFGRSLGSAFACRVAAETPAKMLILETPFASMKDLFYTYYPWLPRVFVFKYIFPNQKHLSKVSCPVYIFQGTDDWVVPYKCAEKLKKYVKPTDEFVTIQGGSHNNLLFYDIYNLKMKEILADGKGF